MQKHNNIAGIYPILVLAFVGLVFIILTGGLKTCKADQVESPYDACYVAETPDVVIGNVHAFNKGTATAISDQYLISCAHLKSDTTDMVYVRRANDKSWLVGKIIDIDRANDISLVKISDPNVRLYWFPPVTPDYVEQLNLKNQKVLTTGFGHSQRELSATIYKVIPNYFDSPQLVMAGSLISGDSGGGIFYDNYLISINSRSSNNPNDVFSLGCTPKALCTFLTQCSTQYGCPYPSQQQYIQARPPTQAQNPNRVPVQQSPTPALSPPAPIASKPPEPICKCDNSDIKAQLAELTKSLADLKNTPPPQPIISFPPEISKPQKQQILYLTDGTNYKVTDDLILKTKSGLAASYDIVTVTLKSSVAEGVTPTFKDLPKLFVMSTRQTITGKINVESYINTLK